MHTRRLALLAFTLMLAACDRQEHTMSQSAPSPHSQSSDLYLHYATNGESNYTDIKVEGDQLTYTFFEDTEGRCEQWLKSEPCWTKADLQTMTRTLAPEDQQDLQATLEYSGILSIRGDQFGATNPRQRAYSERLEVRANGQERKLTYRSRPDAQAKPAAFREVEVALRGYLSARK